MTLAPLLPHFQLAGLGIRTHAATALGLQHGLCPSSTQSSRRRRERDWDKGTDTTVLSSETQGSSAESCTASSTCRNGSRTHAARADVNWKKKSSSLRKGERTRLAWQRTLQPKPEITVTLHSRLKVQGNRTQTAEKRFWIAAGVNATTTITTSTYFSNQRVRFVVWRIIFNRFGELISLSSLVHTLPTSSEGCTALATTKQEAEECSVQIIMVCSVFALKDDFLP